MSAFLEARVKQKHAADSNFPSTAVNKIAATHKRREDAAKMPVEKKHRAKVHSGMKTLADLA